MTCLRNGNRKGGRLAASQLRTQLADPIAHRAVAEAEPFSHVARCVLVDEDRPQNFVTELSDRIGMQKELLTSVSIHRKPSLESVIPLDTENAAIMMFSPAGFQARSTPKTLDNRTKTPLTGSTAVL